MTTTTIPTGWQHAVHVPPALDQHPTLEGGPAVSANLVTNLDRREYAREVYRRQAYGRWHPWVDAAPVRAVVEAKMEALGVPYTRIAERAGVHPRVVHHLLWGDPLSGRPPARRVRPQTAARLLAEFTVVTPAGAVRRLRALEAAGHSLRSVAADMGSCPVFLRAVAAGDREPGPILCDKIAEAYRRRANTLPPENTPTERSVASRARGHAAKHGWDPPGAWDEEVTLPVMWAGCGGSVGVFYVARGIDDPLARPYPCKRGKGVPSVDVAADFAELAARHPDRFAEPERVRGDIAQRLGISRRTLGTKLRRAAAIEGRAAA